MAPNRGSVGSTNGLKGKEGAAFKEMMKLYEIKQYKKGLKLSGEGWKYWVAVVSMERP